MRKVIVFQHVANKILGTLDPLLKKKGLRIRYVNFDRHPDTRPSIDRYDGLVILGGHMGVYEADTYTHIKVEMEMIEQALKKQIPILGICLGSQILAHVLGSTVRKSPEKEIGWYDIDLTAEGKQAPLFEHFQAREKLFQLHGDTFDIPRSAVHLASSAICSAQAFRYGDKAYGLQFHLEVDEAMIHRWLLVPANVRELEASGGKFTAETIRSETQKNINRSIELSTQTFQTFINMIPMNERPLLLGSGHGKK